MHAPVKPSQSPAYRSPGIGLVLRLAIRDLLAGLRGFGIFIACLALGVMTIAAVASASRGLTEGLAREGRRILGGDATFSLIHREATPTELSFLTAHGTVSSIATMRGMANAGEKGAALVEIKAVDAAYPSIGTVETDPQAPLPGLLDQRDGAYGAVADPVLFGRLDLKPGDIVTVGGTKNGMLFGDAILVRRPEHFDGIEFVQKQIGQLASKQRYVAAQFDALLRGGEWLDMAAHANAMAARLSKGMAALGLQLAVPTEANEVFVNLDEAAYTELSKGYAVHRPDPPNPVVRFVCSWATTIEQVDEVLTALGQL